MYSCLGLHKAMLHEMTCTLSWSPHASIPKRVSLKGNLTNRKANLEGPTPKMQHISGAATWDPWVALSPVTTIITFVPCWFSAQLLTISLGKALAVLYSDAWSPLSVIEECRWTFSLQVTPPGYQSQEALEI